MQAPVIINNEKKSGTKSSALNEITLYGFI